MQLKKTQSFIDEPDLEKRVKNQWQLFQRYYKSEPKVVVRSPGRAEILGNHTDYNYGFALAAAISRSILALFQKRNDHKIRIISSYFPGEEVIFDINSIKRNEKQKWGNYPKAVIKELLLVGSKINGADILIDSNVPKSGGVSSSAAFELAIACGLLALYKEKYNPLDTALLCQKAENSSIVRSPCGFLDQGTVALGKRNKMVFFDFLPNRDLPISRVELIPSSLESKNASFIVIIDPTLERQLGESGYVARRKMCEESLRFWSKELGKKVTSLRDISISEFEAKKPKLDRQNRTMRMRVEHVIYENFRVLEAIKSLKQNNVNKFAKLLNKSRRSALDLYELDENTPQLTFLIEVGRKAPGVLGIRNMGGGFSAIALALVHSEAIAKFQKYLKTEYKNKFGNELQFINFKITQGTEILTT